MFFSFKKFFLGMFIVIYFFGCEAVYAGSSEKKISIDLQNVNIQDVIDAIAKLGQLNVVISPAVHGVATVHFQAVAASKALDVLLAAHDLAKWDMNNVWFVMPRAELMRQQQDEVKLQALLNESAPLITRVWHIRYAKAADVAHLLQEGGSTLLSKRGQVRVDARTNTVCVQDCAERLAAISTLVQQLDVPVHQVLIEAHLASIDSDYERELGIGFSVQPATDTNNSLSNAVNSHYSLAVARLANNTMLDVQLAALESEGHGELISSPSLFTANLQPASIESGEEIPYQEVSKSGATGVVFKKAVLSLKVMPQVMPGQQILLQLQINQDKPSSHVVLGVPMISTRQMSTNILVKNGQTVVLGGIYEANHENEQQRIPFLGKIPLIGELFTQRQTTKNKRELLIFVTPKIIV